MNQEQRKLNQQNKLILMENFKLTQAQAQQTLIQANYKMNKAHTIILGKQKYLPPGLTRRQTKSDPTFQQHAQTEEEQMKQSILKQQNKKYKNKQQNQAKKVQLERQQKMNVNIEFRRIYMVKKPLNKKKFFKNRQGKQEQQKQFLPQFQFYLGRISSINFIQQINDVFQTLLQTKKFIAIHVINISANKEKDTTKFSTSEFQKTLTTKVLKDFYFNRKITKVFNKQFINYGLDPQIFDFAIYPYMKEFVDPETDKFCINILKYSEKTNRIVLGRKVTIFQFLTSKDTKDTHQFGKKVIIMKKKIQKTIEDKELVEFGMVKQQEVPENRSVYQDKDKDRNNDRDNDRQLKTQQNMQYERMRQKYKQKNRKIRQERIQNGEQSEEEMEKMKQEVMKSINESILVERQQLRKNLPIYKIGNTPNSIEFKLRCPNGKLLTLLVDKYEKIKYLYNYVLSLQDNDLGFRNDMYRIFDLVQPLQDLKLIAKKQQKIGQIFKNSTGQLLIIKQNVS